MNISDLLETFKKYGYDLEFDKIPDISHSYLESLKGVKNPLTKYDKLFHLKWRKNNNHDISFDIYENTTLCSNGTNYNDPGRLYYFFSFNFDVSEVYRDDNLTGLLSEWNLKLKDRLEIEELREFKLANIGV